MENFKNKLRLIGFVPIGSLAQGIANIILFAVCSLFFDWTFQDIINQRVPIEKLAILGSLIYLPTTVLGYKVSHLIKPIKLTNKKFINTHLFFIGINLAFNLGGYFWGEDLGSQLLGSLTVLINLGIFTLMIRDRKYNLFNMGAE